ncbi:MAG: hypothetical protein L5655_00435 [Thermosediminibacteraceae bacterium]|nr:hypothetical protein [Thermosediminibacteraceae bacterium]MCG0274615.1 hypothetical protein [Thermosediminibacteraceae bacterium]
MYSFAESLAAFAKATKWVTLLGRRTGGDGISLFLSALVLLS